MTHIGSFFGVSEVNAEVKKFINTWSADMKNYKRAWRPLSVNFEKI